MSTTDQLHYLSHKFVFMHIIISKHMEIHNKGENLFMTDVTW